MDEIVRRLRGNSQERIKSLKESMPVNGINEAEEDEEDISVAPDEELDNTDVEDEVPEEDNSEESEEEPERKSPPENNPNPLDNIYAVNFKLGQEVVLNFSSTTDSKLEGIIEGYDKEGFYRVKWSNGLTTNGITDIAISELLGTKEESKCVCGGTDFVNEGKKIVCDRCGRLIKESSDPLTLADKSRPKGKRLIRSEAHPISTAISEDKSSSIHNSIRKALGKKSVIEEKRQEYKGYEIYSPTEEGDYEVYIKKDGKDLLDDEGGKLVFNWNKDAREYIDSLNESEEDSEAFNRLQSKLENEFWTSKSEMVDSIEELGYEVIDYDDEYVVVAWEDEEGDEGELQIPIGGTSRTMTLNFDKARFFAVMD